MFGKAGAKDMKRVKPQRSRRVRGAAADSVNVDDSEDGRMEMDSKIGIWVSDMIDEMMLGESLVRKKERGDNLLL
jgi:hypothetical protein